MSSASSTEVPFDPSHTGKKAIANWMTSKAVKLDPALLMSYCVVTVRVGPKMLRCLDILQVGEMFVGLVV